MIKDFIDVNEVSNKIKNNSTKLVLDAESNYRGQLFKVANAILKNRKKYKMVLIAGPSCSGKTTTANLLKEILENKGKKVIVVGMDNFFLNRKDTPNLPNGDKDFDSLRAVNLDLLESCFTELFTKGKAGFPEYNFKTGINTLNSFTLDYKDKPIIIFEGIHALNPELIKRIGTDKVYKIYIGTISGFAGKDGIKMSGRQVRLVRLLLRDAERRGHTPEYTLKAWPNVCDAEDSFIAPYEQDANYYINTTHSYELALYKTELFKILCENRELLNRLPFLDLFDETVSLNKEQLPETTLMWEFLDKPEKTANK